MSALGDEGVDCFDVMDKRNDTAGEDEKEGDDTERSNDVETDENIYKA
jgi:hypothetical protein